MSIDWPQFTPAAALLGGLLIGVASALLLLFNGRIAGISGIVGALLRPVRGETGWRVAFIAGLIAAPVLYGVFSIPPEPQVDAGWATLVAAGLCVGFGARYGSGCTSGHGVCGLSRLSFRSFVATLCFLSTGFITVYIVRHLLGA